MNTNSNDFSRNMREALEKYESRFPMPENLISDTMAHIETRCEQRARVRGLLAVIAGALAIIACGVAGLLYLPLPTFIVEARIPAVPSVHINHTLIESANLMGNLLANPMVEMMVVITAILFTLDRLLRNLALRRSTHPSKK